MRLRERFVSDRRSTEEPTGGFQIFPGRQLFRQTRLGLRGQSGANFDGARRAAWIIQLGLAPLDVPIKFHQL